ncbi:MAG: sulfurtransferase TusA family protein [Marmoricola sp.]
MSAVQLDCRGMLCPRPIIELAKALPRVPVGGLIEVIADDAAAAVDVPAWCRMRSQEYVGAADGDDGATTSTVRRLA